MTINMNTKNPLEQLLYPPSLEEVKTRKSTHKYEYGMLISINNHRQLSADILLRLPHYYQTLIHTICGNKIGRTDITATRKRPPQEVIADLVAQKKLIVVAGIHDYHRKNYYDTGSSKNFDYQHSHLYVYGAHHYLPRDPEQLKNKEDLICANFKRHAKPPRYRSQPTQIDPVGRGINCFTDAITPSNLYDYFLTADPKVTKRNLLHYISNNRHNPTLQYPITYLYQK